MLLNRIGYEIWTMKCMKDDSFHSENEKKIKRKWRKKTEMLQSEGEKRIIIIILWKWCDIYFEWKISFVENFIAHSHWLFSIFMHRETETERESEIEKLDLWC